MANKKITFKDIDRARKILGLRKTATLEEIKDVYRALSKKYHPDTCKHRTKSECEEMMKSINHARDSIISYCAQYRFSFTEKEVSENDIDTKFEDESFKRFYHDWL